MTKQARQTASEPPHPASIPGSIETLPPQGDLQQPRMLDVATYRSNPVLRPLVERAVSNGKDKKTS